MLSIDPTRIHGQPARVLAANAFFDTISSKKQVGIARRVRATPTDSLLNRAKLAQTKRGLVGKALAKLDPMRLVGGAVADYTDPCCAL